MKFTYLMAIACLLFIGSGCGESSPTTFSLMAENRTSSDIRLRARGWAIEENGFSSFSLIETVAAGRAADFGPLPEIKDGEHLIIVIDIDQSANGTQAFQSGPHAYHNVTGARVVCSAIVASINASGIIESTLECQN